MEDVMAEFVGGLRALADWYEAHPEQPRPLTQLHVFALTKGDLLDAARALGTARKGAYGEWYWVSRNFGGGVVLEYNVARSQVCTRRVVGTTVVPAQPEHTVEIEEWDCGTLTEDLGLVAVPTRE